MRQKALIYGFGNIYRKNICWIRQLYRIVGITDAKIDASCKEKDMYTVEEAVKLDFEIIIVTSSFFDEIKRRLVNDFGIEDARIRYFLEEFSYERHESFGEKNPDITFYIFRAHWQESRNGFYNFFDRVFASLYEVRKQGFEILVDMKNYYTEYAGLERYGIVNVWEDYYEQPSSFTLDEAYQSKNVILSKFNEEKYNLPFLMKERSFTNQWWIETYKILSKLFVIIPGRVLKERINSEIERLNILEGETLGVLARGTDYVSLKPKDHPIPLNTKSLINECKKRLLNGEYKYIYIATEDLDILEEFKNNFGDRLLFSEQMRMRQDVKETIMSVEFDRENDKYLRGLEYCTVIEILSKCRSLLANCCCYGALGAIAINGGRYSSCEVMDVGNYD